MWNRIVPVADDRTQEDEFEMEGLTTCFEYGEQELKARSLPHLLQKQADLRGDAPFLQCWDDSLKNTVSFTELARRVEGASVALAEDFGVKVSKTS